MLFFSERKFALLFQHTTVNNFGKQKHINKRMEHSQWIIKLVLKSNAFAPDHIIFNYLHFALISMETEFHW